MEEQKCEVCEETQAEAENGDTDLNASEIADNYHAWFIERE